MLSQELKASRTQLNVASSELEEMKKSPMTTDEQRKLEEEMNKQSD